MRSKVSRVPCENSIFWNNACLEIIAMQKFLNAIPSTFCIISVLTFSFFFFLPLINRSIINKNYTCFNPINRVICILYFVLRERYERFKNSDQEKMRLMGGNKRSLIMFLVERSLKWSLKLYKEKLVGSSSRDKLFLQQMKRICHIL